MKRKVMNNKMKIFLAWMLVVVMQLTTILPLTAVYAAEEQPVAKMEVYKSGVSVGFVTEGAISLVVTTTVEVPENYRPMVGDKLALDLKFILPQGHDYGEGTTFTYDLPTPLKAASGEGPLGEYGNYKVENGKVIITFNDAVRVVGDGGSQGIETDVQFGIEAQFELDGSNNGREQVVKLPGGQIINIDFIPDRGEVITKTVLADNGGEDSQYVTWTVNVNTVMEDLGSGKDFIDELTGMHQYKSESLKVTKYKLDAKGSPTPEEDVTTTYKAIFEEAVAAASGSITFKLTGKYAYKIVYQTVPDDTDEPKETLSNLAKFNDKSADKSVTISYGDPLAKTVVQPGKDEIAKWTVTVNENRKNLRKGLEITDTWNSTTHKFIPGSFEVKGINSSDYKVTDTASDTSYGFILTLKEDISEPFTITYETKPKDLITENTSIKNTVVRNDRDTDIKTATAIYNQKVLSKTNANINYQNKTVEWTIIVNSAGYDMKDIVIKDEFEMKNLKIIDETFKVHKGNIPLEKGDGDSQYQFVHVDGNVLEDKKGGFILKIPNKVENTNEIIKITYTTEYDVKGASNLDTYTNKVKMEWKTTEKQYETDTIVSTVDINKQQKNKGYKIGSYNYENKKFNWSVGINYNFDTIANAKFTDTLSESQKVDRDSIKVYKLDLTGDENGKREGNDLDEGKDYTLTPGELTNTFELAFKHPISEPYRIEYISTNKDEYYAPTEPKPNPESEPQPKPINHSVENKAQLTGDNGYKAEWKKKVEVAYTENLISKGFTRAGQSSKLKWTMKLNWGQSTLNDVVIADTVGNDGEGNPNQMIYKDSFEIQEIDLSGTSDATDPINPTERLGAIHKPGEGLYTVNFDKPDSTFEINFDESINKAYVVRYETYYLGGNNETLKNEAKLTYNTKENNKGTDEHQFLKSSFQISGNASAKKAQLIITKVDEENNNEKLTGAEFELWSAKTGGFLIEKVIKDINGVYTFNTKVGQTKYYLKETKAPEGYLLKDDWIEVDLKNPNTEDKATYVKAISVENTKLVPGVTLSKIDAESDKGLEGAVFELYDSTDPANHKLVGQPYTTDFQGKISVGNLNVGTYYFKEIQPPESYLLPIGENTKTDQFTITANQVINKQIIMKNARGTGKIIIKKQDLEGNKLLEGVKFSLTKKSAEPFSSGVTTILATTNAQGIAEFIDLPYDTYILKETETLSNYVLNSSNEEIILDSSADSKEETRTITNIKKDYSVQLTKYSADNSSKLEGVIFELRKEVNGNYEVVAMDETKLTTNVSGIIALKSLDVGKYQLVEKTALNGYVLDQRPVAFEIENDQTEPKMVEKINTMIKGNIAFEKVDENNKPLPGAEFSVYHAENELVSIGKATSGETGTVVFEDLLFGSYMIKETKAPMGYVLSEKVLTATISEDGQTVAATPTSISNRRIRGDFELTKTNELGSVFLPNAKIAVYTEEGILIGEKATNDEGIVKFEDLAYGKYYYVETQAPAGYRINNTQYPFEIKEDGETVGSTLSNRRIPSVDPDEPVGGGGGGNPPKPTDPVDPTDPTDPIGPVDPTDPTDPVDPTVPVVPLVPVAPVDPTEPPKYRPIEAPSPSDPNSPDEFILIDDDGVPVGKYTKQEQPDGTFIYVDENGIPLGSDQVPKGNGNKAAGGGSVPKTGDDMPVLPLTILFMVSLFSAIGLMIFKKKRFN